MAVDVTALYARFRSLHRLSADECHAMCGAAKIVNTPEESRALDQRPYPAVIVAASGMATGGRVLHHLRALAPDPRNTILFSGYQAAGTRGGRIVAGEPAVKIHGHMVPIRAEVAQLDGLSAHADRVELLEWLRGFRTPPRRTFVTHGEPAAAEAHGGAGARRAALGGGRAGLPRHRSNSRDAPGARRSGAGAAPRPSTP